MKLPTKTPAGRPASKVAPLDGRTNVPSFTSQFSAVRKFRVASCGGKGSGKTRLAATMPGRVGILPLDINTRETMFLLQQEFPEKTFLLPCDAHGDPVDLLAVEGLEEVEGAIRADKHLNAIGKMGDKDKAEEAKNEAINNITQLEIGVYRNHLSRIEHYYNTLTSSPYVDSILIDTGTELNMVTTMAHFGKTFQVDRRQMGSLLDPVMARFWTQVGNRKHLLMTHYWMEEWVSNKSTGRWVLRGWRHTNFNANCCVTHIKAQTREELTRLEIELEVAEQVQPGTYRGTFPNPTYAMRIYDSNVRPDLVAEGTLLFNDNISFPQLAVMVYPDTEESDWL